VNDSFILKDVALVLNLHLNLLFVSQLLENDYEVHFKRALLKFWMLRGILFVKFLLLFEFFKQILYILLALLDVFWQDPLL
jgi:hypothetical protein